ncbi:MAG: DUF559 domain-containing protein [Gemmatimonadaceae bacterium]|nr:DUF559 domain-containing protein [Gemmatimonadaceae bacterium]
MLLDSEFESPAEREFAHQLWKHIGDDVVTEAQVTTQTERGRFRLDFVLSHSDVKLAIEIDGQHFHTLERDAARDALVLGAGHVHEVVRIAARGVAFHLHDVLYLLSEMHPRFFSTRGRESLRILSSPYARLATDSQKQGVAIFYPLPDRDPDLAETEDSGYDTPPKDWRDRDVRVLGRVTGETFLGVVIKRRFLGFETAFVDFARANLGTSFETLVEKYFQQA